MHDIRQLHSQSGNKLASFEDRIANMRATLRFF